MKWLITSIIMLLASALALFGCANRQPDWIENMATGKEYSIYDFHGAEGK